MAGIIIRFDGEGTRALLESLGPEAKVELQTHMLKTALERYMAVNMPVDFKELCSGYMEELECQYFDTKKDDLSPWAKKKIEASARAIFKDLLDEFFNNDLKAKMSEVLELQKEEMEYRVKLALARWETHVGNYLKEQVNGKLLDTLQGLISIAFPKQVEVTKEDA